MDSRWDRNQAARAGGETVPKRVGTLSYRQIADILARVEGTPMTPKRVAQICRTAEVKFARALMGDRVFCERLSKEGSDASEPS
jgi:hypothetical protein